MKILAVDPGMGTGWARWVDGDLEDYGEMDHNEFAADAYETLEMAGSHWAEPPIDLNVCEDYIITPQTLKKTRQLYSLHLIGFLKYLCDINEVEFILQKPSDAKRFADDDKLKLLDWYNPTTDGHQNDALRHLLTYLVSRKLISLGVFLNG